MDSVGVAQAVSVVVVGSVVRQQGQKTKKPGEPGFLT
jgi:hypothetical protein